MVFGKTYYFLFWIATCAHHNALWIFFWQDCWNNFDIYKYMDKHNKT
jgi:hypothetical protein